MLSSSLSIFPAQRPFFKFLIWSCNCLGLTRTIVNNLKSLETILNDPSSIAELDRNSFYVLFKEICKAYCKIFLSSVFLFDSTHKAERNSALQSSLYYVAFVLFFLAHSLVDTMTVLS